ncbi:hypothetical protein HDU89_007365 [Geranomyces variabilis]|nr:hypothetical protein HDU89_007365 [Geranomyces variabilis]
MHAFSRLPVPAETQKPATRSSMVQKEVPCSPAGAYLAIRPQRSPAEAHVRSFRCITIAVQTFTDMSSSSSPTFTGAAKVRHDAEVALRALSDADLVSFGPVDGGDADWFPWIPNEDDQLLDTTEPEGWMLDADWSDIPFVGGAADPFLSWFSDADEWLSETSQPEGWLADVHWSDSPTLKVQKTQVAASGDASEDSEDDGDGAASECSLLDDETAPDGWFEDLPGSLDPINVDPAEDSWFLDVDGLEDRSAGGVAIHSTLVSAGSSGGARTEIDRLVAEILALASDPGQPIVPGPVDVEVGVDIADANGERVEQAPLDPLPLREILRLPMGEARTQALRQRPRDANRSGRSAVALKLFVWVVNRREEPPQWA